MNSKILFAALLVTAASLSVKAAEHIVEAGDINMLMDLIVRSAGEGDTITLKPGVYDLSNTNVTKTPGYATAYLKLTGKQIILRGQNNKHWRDKTSEEETVLRGGSEGSIFYAHGQKPRKSSIYNITFENGYQPEDSGNNNKVGGGAISWAATDGISPSEGFGLVSNCVFRNCGSDYSGGATYGIDAYDCLYTNCYSKVNGGGAYGFFKTGPHTNLFANCVFKNNGASGSGAALYCRYMDTVKGCVFKDNYATNSCGGVYAGELGGTVISCTFYDNDAEQIKSGTQIKNVSKVVDSLFCGNGTINATEIDRCKFDGASCGFVNNYQGLVTFDVATGNGRIANSLFTECETPRLIVNAGVRVDIENCTFVENTIAGLASKNYLFYAFRSEDLDAQKGTNIIYNCLFSSNTIVNQYNEDGTWSVNSYNTSGATNIVHNSMYVGSWGEDGSTSTIGWHNSTSIDDVASVKFAAGSSKYPTAPYYMPTKYSPAFNAGLVRPWMATGKDLAGNPRITGDGVDIGCYEWNIPDLGTKIILR